MVQGNLEMWRDISPNTLAPLGSKDMMVANLMRLVSLRFSASSDITVIQSQILEVCAYRVDMENSSELF